MKRINTLFYCTFFDARKRSVVLDKDGCRLCCLISSDDFASFLQLDITICIIGVFQDQLNNMFDDMDVSYENSLVFARDNAKKLLATFSLS